MQLEQITGNLSLVGMEPTTIVTVVAVVPIVEGTIQVIYRTHDGVMKDRLLNRNDEASISIAQTERPWAFDGDGEAFKLAIEAKRIDLAFLFDLMMAVHTSNVEPLPHQITAVYESLLPRQPLRFLLADDPGAGKTIMAGLYIRELTATPHNGKEEDFQLFLSLLDSDRFYGRFRDGVHKVDASDLMRRMIKEELVKFDGTPLFPERRAYTVNYALSDLEAALYEDVTQYVKTEMGKADELDGKRKGSIGFALTILQRRLASSPEAIFQSLRRRHERLERRLREELIGNRGRTVLSGGNMVPPEDDEDLTAEEQENLEETMVDDSIVTIHGGTHRDERRKMQALFRSDPDVRVLVATDAAGEGVNLQNANLMVNYDLPWNPNRLEQRFGRIHRIGQHEVCHLWNLVAKETREGDVYFRLLQKMDTVGAGCRVVDVSAQKCGWDLTSYPPLQDGGDPGVRHIEVKGRAKGATTITVTRNEILYALNQADKFVLAAVLVGEDNSIDGPYYISQPFDAEPGWGVSSINYDLSELLTRGIKS